MRLTADVSDGRAAVGPSALGGAHRVLRLVEERRLNVLEPAETAQLRSLLVRVA